MKKISLNSFSEGQKLRTGFYSKRAYAAFKDICKEMRRNKVFGWYSKVYVLQSSTSEVIVCTDLQDNYSWVWKDKCIQYPPFGEKGNLTLREAMKIAIADYATGNCDCLEIQAWAKGKDPIDADLFKTLVGTPENPIKAELNDLAIQEETKLTEKFTAYRDEVIARKFISPNVMFAIEPSTAVGHNGYVRGCSFSQVLSQNEMTELYDAEAKMHVALQSFIDAKNAYSGAFEQWHKVNRKTSHLLTVAKNKELSKLKKSMKAIMQI